MAQIKCPKCAELVLAADGPAMKRYAAQIRAAEGRVAICPTCRTFGDDDGAGAWGGGGAADPSAPTPPSPAPPSPSGGGANWGAAIGGAVQALPGLVNAGVQLGEATGLLKTPPPPPPPPPRAPPPPPPVVVLSFRQRHRDLFYGAGGLLVAVLVVAVIMKFADKDEKKKAHGQ